jgi:hypothetical protein
MRARIYQPARTAMSSGTAKTNHWLLEFAPSEAREVDPLMGWTSSADTQAQVRLSFDSKAAAVEYAREHGIDAQVQEPHKRKPNIRPGGYGETSPPAVAVPGPTERTGSWPKPCDQSPPKRLAKTDLMLDNPAQRSLSSTG